MNTSGAMDPIGHGVVDAMLRELASLNTAMVASAREQDWVTVANLEAVRHALLKALLEGTERPQPQVLAPVLEAVLACDRDILQLAEPARTRLSADILAFRQGRRARAAYAETGTEPP